MSYHANIDNTFHNKSDFHSRHAVQQKISCHNQDQLEQPTKAQIAIVWHNDGSRTNKLHIKSALFKKTIYIVTFFDSMISLRILGSK